MAEIDDAGARRAAVRTAEKESPAEHSSAHGASAT
jgi:hypothetical protein